MNTFARQLRFAGRVILALCLTLPALAAELADFETPLFSGAGKCAFCHDPWNPKQAGQPGEAAVLTTDWRATMMAHAFKDPLWRAVMEAEVKERPELKSFIENKCQTCHAPLARTSGASRWDERTRLRCCRGRHRWRARA
ncbi:MAG: hypothetical protein V9H26_05945 [Verrucomicrobiota bacterium]